MESKARRIGRSLRRRTRDAVRRFRNGLTEYRRGVEGRSLIKVLENAEVDPRITYPAYKSLDEFIDVEHLRSLDEFIQDRVLSSIRAGQFEPFHTGRYRRKLWKRTYPGSKNLLLSQMNRPYDYADIGNPEAWEPAPLAEDFGELMEFIETLPFRGTARMLLMVDEKGREITAHRDHPLPEMLNEFIWFRTNLKKPFYLQSSQTGERKYVTSHSAWFDTVNQWHGGDATGELAISLRVDGAFTDEFRARIPKPGCNPASTAALWAALADE